ncbi:MAG: shikimate dehydrogenase [Eubacterium sp.]|nr:shikimate dehydrogenase [Eubacterium sp.]
MIEQITGKTGLICLLGSPVAHSISPAMHNEAFGLLGLDYAYLAFDVDEAALPEAVAGLKAMGARGWNLTMPDKTAMMDLLDEVSPAAKIVGAVNTVVNEGGRLVGYTTDGSGYMAMLAEAGIDVIGKKLVMAGAGGAARAIAAQAALDGVAELVIFNRSEDKARKIADDINASTACQARAYALADTNQLKGEMAEAALFVNATKIGMAPDTGASVIADDAVFESRPVVSDIIYEPRKTALLKRAEACGCQTINGMGMLLWQGVHAFKLWTGREMPVAAIQEKYFR